MSEDLSKSRFRSASKEVLEYLHDRLHFDLWMVTRTKSNDWVVLQAADVTYGIKSGHVFQWADSFCSRMVNGEGPRIAPRSEDIPCYKSAPIASQVPIGAYIGIPLKRDNGELFGTLCAIDPDPKPEEITQELPQIEMMARLLETILEAESRAHDEARRAERAEAQAMSDYLTGLYNRRGWDHLLAAEEYRCQHYAHPAAILSVDLDELKKINDAEGHMCGDMLIQHTAKILRENVRSNDIVARVGGDEFLILAVECKEHGAPGMAERIANVLAEHDIVASVGFGIRLPNGSLADAAKIADEAMYQQKTLRKEDRMRIVTASW